MQGREDPTVVIVAYRPKPGKEAELLQLTREHLPLLRRERLVTERPETTARAADGTIVEVFEWAHGGMQRAHANAAVLALWQRYSEVCEYLPLNQLSESSSIFASFTPVDLG